MERAGQSDVGVVDHDGVVGFGILQAPDAGIAAAAIAVHHRVAGRKPVRRREGDLVAGRCGDRDGGGRGEGQRVFIDGIERLVGRVDRHQRDRHPGMCVGLTGRHLDRRVVDSDAVVTPTRCQPADTGLAAVVVVEVDDLLAGRESVRGGEDDLVGVDRISRCVKHLLSRNVDAAEAVVQAAPCARQRHCPACHGIVERGGQLDRLRIGHDHVVRLPRLQAGNARSIAGMVDHPVAVLQPVAAPESDRVTSERDS